MPLSPKEEQILYSIFVASENNPSLPEFPPDNPRFPASQTSKIHISGFSNVWLKDESTNPTGTHKDRMAWEIVVAYRSFLIAKKNNNLAQPLPQMSIISSGSTAIAIQSQLGKYDLPNLKVLVDEHIDDEIACYLEDLGCKLYRTDLSVKTLDWRDILALTENPSGFDITSNAALDPATQFYDWMGYEILNESPDYCFIPFGTGNLYENVLNINRHEITAETQDPRFDGDKSRLSHCNFMGATSTNQDSKADKLYSPHLPFIHYDEQWIRFYRQSGFCGPESRVIAIEEFFLDHAMEYAERLKITCEPSGIAGLALLLQLSDELPKDQKMLIINTGKTKLS